MNETDGNKGELKVGYILRAFPVPSETFVLNEILALRKAGMPMEIFVLSSPAVGNPHQAQFSEVDLGVIYWQQQRPSRLEVLGANLQLLARCGVRRYWQARRIIGESRVLAGWRAFLRLAWWAAQLQRWGVTHLHAHFATEATTVAWAFSLLTGIRFSFTAHAYDIYVSPYKLYERLEAAAFVVTVSHYNKVHLLALNQELPPAKVHILHGWVNLENVKPSSQQTGSLFQILSVGRLVEKKGHIYLIEACAQLRAQGIAFKCYIVGEGPLRQELEAAITADDLEEHVQLLGAVSHDRVLALLDNSSVFALPCVVTDEGDRDGIPVSLAEAMAMQLPVISTDIVGISELVQEGAGFLVSPRDAGALAEALRKAYEMDNVARMEMGRRGRSIVKAEFNLESEVGKLIRLFRTTQRREFT
jgi:glycosyltransferase involved in cell wall biosynthesis